VQLAGKVAIVTGAGHGIGRALTLMLAGRDACVVAVDRSPEALSTLGNESGQSHVDGIAMDVSDPTHARRLVDEVLSRHDTIDVVVANAGFGYFGEFATMPPEQVDEMIDVNLRAPIALCRAVLPTMLSQRRGTLVLVTSIAGALLVPRETVYSMTKSGLEAFAEPLREELRGSGVHVSTIMPGVVATGFFDRRGEPYDRRFPRPVTAERVAAEIVRAIEQEADRVVIPRWLGVPIRLRGIAPGVYRSLARRFG
jgi:short-subunit dehydrogenase